MDPHGAVGYQAINKSKNLSDHHIVLETAHPAKFMDIVTSVIEVNFDMPKRLQDCLDKPKNAILVSDDYEDFKTELINWIS